MYGDYLKLFLHLENGGDVNEYTPWTGLLCGTLSEVPHVLYSSGPGLVLEFHTTAPVGNSSGFKGTFRFIDRRKYCILYGNYNVVTPHKLSMNCITYPNRTRATTCLETGTL